MTCQLHPTYVGKGKPTGNCPDCWSIWRKAVASRPPADGSKVKFKVITHKEMPEDFEGGGK